MGFLAGQREHAHLTRAEPVRPLAAHRTPGAISSAVIMITRDESSELRFGSGPWDHARLARTITALRSAGAVVVGLDIPIGEPSPPARGGAASDAMLVEATKTAGRIIYPLSVQLSAEQVSKQDRGRSLWQVVSTAGALPLLGQHGRRHWATPCCVLMGTVSFAGSRCMSCSATGRFPRSVSRSHRYFCRLTSGCVDPRGAIPHPERCQISGWARGAALGSN